MIIGDYKIHSFISEYFKLDGGIVFGIIPKTLWSRTVKSDADNRVQLCNRILFLDNGKRKIIIDTGTGDKLSKKLKEIYVIDNSDCNLFLGLDNLNVKPEEITDVILTHLHFDHSGGSTYYNDNRELTVSFPNAVYYVQEKQYEWAILPNERERASFFPNDFEPLDKSGQLRLIKGNYQFDDYIELIPLSGHTRDMMVVKITDGKTTLLHTADLVPMEMHLSLPTISAIDALPLMSLCEKKILLSSAVTENWVLFLCHDPQTECIKVNFDRDIFFTKEKLQID
ncbi:MAG: MBL fold metallo-hydrolase [Ignavibacteria bacterium]|nr:MBL fold metallo-hydrolase [Ignavibacteria bacterium]